MRIYMAAVYTSSFHQGRGGYNRLLPHEQQHRENVEHILESYHYIHKQNYVEAIKTDKRRIFLDSGAFSAYTQGVTIDINTYCEYIRRNNCIIEQVDGQLYASVLDAVGDPLKTWQNQETMEKQGIYPLPCFHYGEDEEYLKWYIEHYKFITIGGMVPIGTAQLLMWLDRIWSDYLTDSAGHPKLKVHGFGLTTGSLMERYPWYSVDSTSWQAMGSMGAIILPGIGAIHISPFHPSAKEKNRHIDNIPKLQAEAIVANLARNGWDIARLKDDYAVRWVYNCWAFGCIQKQINETRGAFKLDQERLF